ncbi:acylphosphatase [Hydrocoleum sp. CS-953]|uniref:acylphosphatase n=1 Tax=Hydrocoleum sp. CS-953 TaxID=1671698 RepID=UPI000B9A319C|nr:acylphosphatase [Hydrocoleum sp. CS-953]OZH52372.1 acylphosphatase [Hydrocoleum sp. CS-953]
MQDQSKYLEFIHAHVLISGKVQGVGYRFSTLNTAVSLGINGWVKNLPDGRVEAVFEGREELVKKMINWCYQGPKSAVVQNVLVRYEQVEGIEGFEIHRIP